uniref:Putative e3 ubiquitin protein ligase nrdp1 n=1 Tax=Ixodes ricinus TaxID=34613 RepID=A0A0K8R3B6_IXORI
MTKGAPQSLIDDVRMKYQVWPVHFLVLGAQTWLSHQRPLILLFYSSSFESVAMFFLAFSDLNSCFSFKSLLGL